MLNKHILHRVHKEGFKEEEVYEAYKIFFGTLVSESRLKIINLLRRREKSVSEIVEMLKLPQPTISHDLARLKKCGFVKVKTVKNFRRYSLNDETIEPLMNLIDYHMEQYCVHILHERKGKKENEK
ncbi:winged helix-turn-helix transcriptional regulator [Candidatus Pacearchaeota archaeon]|nr:winged helix-turn-helix transcriptional regulator [Candidatus Pacearchaeota archaeon]